MAPSRQYNTVHESMDVVRFNGVAIPRTLLAEYNDVTALLNDAVEAFALLDNRHEMLRECRQRRHEERATTGVGPRHEEESSDAPTQE